MGRHLDLKLVGVELAPEAVADLVHVELEAPDAVDADQRRIVADLDARLVTHHVGDGLALDAVAKGDPALVGEGPVEL